MTKCCNCNWDCRCRCARGIEDVPCDGKLYGRKNRQWVEIRTGKSKQIQTDWEQEDERQVDYVKNRPKVNEVILTGNRELPEIPITNLEIEKMFSKQILSKERKDSFVK